MRLLVRREHSKRELLRKLTLRDFSAEQSLPVIEALEAEGLQNDARFAENYSRVRVQKGYGPTRIHYELRERGVNSFALDLLVDEMDEDWDSLIQKVYKHKYAEWFDGGFKEVAKQGRFLQHRGFTTEQIRNLFSTLKSENQKRRSV